MKTKRCEYCGKELKEDKYVSFVSKEEYCNEECYSKDVDEKYSYYRH